MALLLLLLARRRAAIAVGLAGCSMNAVILDAFAVTRYLSVGGGEMPRVAASTGKPMFGRSGPLKCISFVIH